MGEGGNARALAEGLMVHTDSDIEEIAADVARLKAAASTNGQAVQQQQAQLAAISHNLRQNEVLLGRMNVTLFRFLERTSNFSLYLGLGLGLFLFLLLVAL